MCRSAEERGQVLWLLIEGNVHGVWIFPPEIPISCTQNFLGCSVEIIVIDLISRFGGVCGCIDDVGSHVSWVLSTPWGRDRPEYGLGLWNAPYICPSPLHLRLGRVTLAKAAVQMTVLELLWLNTKLLLSGVFTSFSLVTDRKFHCNGVFAGFSRQEKILCR